MSLTEDQKDKNKTRAKIRNKLYSARRRELQAKEEAIKNAVKAEFDPACESASGEVSAICKTIDLESALMAGYDGCLTCPFTISEESEQAQNYGCLPTNVDILNLARAEGKPWGCHGDENRICRGYASVAKRLALPLSGTTIKYSEWTTGSYAKTLIAAAEKSS